VLDIDRDCCGGARVRETLEVTRRLAFLVLATLAVLCLSLVSSAAQAQTEPTKSPVDIREPDPVPPDASSIPRPNSGTAPQGPGDLGGGLQLTLLGLIAAFPVVAVLGIRRAARASAKSSPTSTSTPASTSTSA
jgi:hypothetical protein